MADPVIDPTKGLEIFTERGLEKIRDAAVSETQVKIKYVALGDANGAPYDPDPTQTDLVNERLRKEIDSQSPAGDKSWLTKTSWEPETDTVIIREIGFFDEDEELICLWAGADVTRFSQTGAHIYMLEHMLGFEGARAGVIVVDAPLEGASILEALRGVDGEGSGLDADLLGGKAASEYVTSEALTSALEGLVDGAPGALNTFNELADAVNNDADFAAQILQNVSNLETAVSEAQSQIDQSMSNVFESVPVQYPGHVGLLTWTHGLGGAPKGMAVKIVCHTAYLDFQPGDEVFSALSWGFHYGQLFRVSATEITMRNSSYGLDMPDPVTGVTTAYDESKFNIQIIAWR